MCGESVGKVMMRNDYTARLPWKAKALTPTKSAEKVGEGASAALPFCRQRCAGGMSGLICLGAMTLHELPDEIGQRGKGEMG
jgi:hypothetical protein